MFKIGVDIGGTFTDFAVWRSGEDTYAQIGSHKLSSSRPNYAEAVVDGLSEIARAYGISGEDDLLVVHGTTVSTNAIIERSQPPVALLTTAGYRDILELARLRLDKPVDLFNRRHPPLTSRENVYEVPERILSDGTVDTPLDTDAVLAAARKAMAEGIRSFAVCFLHSYRSPRHEKQAAELLRDTFPEVDVVASHEVWPQQSEYERAVLTLLNTYVKDIMSIYLREIEDYLARTFPRARLLVMKSNGGAMSSQEARALPVHTLLSGPAAGVTGAYELARKLDAGSVLTMDMGGTSTDVSLVQPDRVPITAQAEVGDFPLLLPVTAVEALGAGGGSVIWLDEGTLKVGPHSAGSVPGPACYGKGGTLPTLSDAYLVNGYLPETGLLGGQLPLSKDRAVASLEDIGRATGAGPDDVADAAIAVATSNMLARTLPFLARLGVEPSELTLMIFGGAGGIHGPLLADELGLRQVLVPRLPSVFCAYGCLVADLVHDAVQSVRGRNLDGRELFSTFQRLQEDGTAWVHDQSSTLTRTLHFAEMRYAAQAFTISVEVTDLVERQADHSSYSDAFHAEHQRLFDHHNPEAPVVIDELRTRSIGDQSKPGAGTGTSETRAHPEPVSRREIRFGGDTIARCAVYERAALTDTTAIRGPAIIEQDVATILVPPSFTARVGALGDLWLKNEV
ncbi:hydantoin utilization protein A [Pseudooceanicola batsensis HTCC2597]|uniref:Hydantoin utilization protein A n=1 Tax=Pseudooceanicola batsensis (strain ATCC BAA-863 / DSM 15984 / KCTC 12145 / HTCC2597) TaxID=252305 RepID=A3U1H9_PSEBH|nr:hydantoinase/oxoprolinase family protein [Pseudooceanicola batsensis]EAQ02162.1 hydantoin utilization protein A [Pseudooceanicola batsensis HTCC2597]